MTLRIEPAVYIFACIDSSNKNSSVRVVVGFLLDAICALYRGEMVSMQRQYGNFIFGSAADLGWHRNVKRSPNHSWQAAMDGVHLLCVNVEMISIV